MKKTILLLFVMFASLTIHAQGNQEKQEAAAKSLVDRMDKVVTLSESEKTQIYDLEMKRIKDKAQVAQDNEGNIEVINEQKKELDKVWRATVSKLITPERMKLWTDHLKEQKEKREQKEQKEQKAKE